mgnify:CR=1 FL=1
MQVASRASLDYEDKFTALMTDLEIRGVLLHEELHCSLLHPLRLTLRPLSR